LADVLLQSIESEPPRGTVKKSELTVTTIGGPTVTVTDTESTALPRPLQVSVYVDVTAGDTDWVPPVITRPPLQAESSGLVAEQLVALPLPHVRVLEPPSGISVKDAGNVGATGGPTVTVTSMNSDAPPSPSHVSR
jgi:hypothetical protein